MLAAFTLAVLLSAKPAAVVSFDKGLANPQSVAYDPVSDSYLVTNLNGPGFARENKGFIVELKPDGKGSPERIIEGGKKGVTLHSPTGIAVRDGVIYVCDLDTVRTFDRSSFAPLGDIALPGFSAASDLAFGPDGALYVSDLGVDAHRASTGTDSIVVIEPSATSAKKVVADTALKGPTGLFVTSEAVLYVTFGGDELGNYHLRARTLGHAMKVPASGVSGLTALGLELLVGSWDGKAIYRGKLNGQWAPVITEVDVPGDFALDSKRRRLVVPFGPKHQVQVWELAKPAF